LVAVVVGTRPFASTRDVDAYLLGRFGLEQGSFITYPYHPEDFLVLFRDAEAMLRFLHAPVSEGPPCFTFRRWRRESWATEVTMPFRIRVGIVGVSAHLWLRSTAQEILGSSCFILELAPETESKANLQDFFVVAECVHPDLIPVEKAMLAPITEDALGQLCLRYKAMIDIIDVVDLRPTPGAPLPPPSAGLSSSSTYSAPPGGGLTGRSGPSSACPQEGVVRARRLAATLPLSSLVDGAAALWT
jgi:hypothetical protein